MTFSASLEDGARKKINIGARITLNNEITDVDSILEDVHNEFTEDHKESDDLRFL